MEDYANDFASIRQDAERPLYIPVIIQRMRPHGFPGVVTVNVSGTGEVQDTPT